MTTMTGGRYLLGAMLPYTSRALLTNTRLMSPDNQRAPSVTLESMTNGMRQVIKVA